jgi:hypothetical protein
MKASTKFFGTLLVISFLGVVFFFDNIKGYYKFKSYCSNEGGLHVYEPLQKNVGWLADDQSDARIASLLSGVSFVRYTDAHDNKSYDVIYLGGSTYRDKSYEVSLSDEKKLVVYKFIRTATSLKNELRLREIENKAIRISDQKLMVEYSIFIYEKFDRANTILDMPSMVSCHVEEPGRPLDVLPLNIKEISSSFK